MSQLVASRNLIYLDLCGAMRLTGRYVNILLTFVVTYLKDYALLGVNASVGVLFMILLFYTKKHHNAKRQPWHFFGSKRPTTTTSASYIL